MKTIHMINLGKLNNFADAIFTDMAKFNPGRLFVSEGVTRVTNPDTCAKHLVMHSFGFWGGVGDDLVKNNEAAVAGDSGRVLSSHNLFSNSGDDTHKMQIMTDIDRGMTFIFLRSECENVDDIL